ncbi:hypothetical protein PSH79_08780 [Pseudomonas sp. FP2196]|uniref:hypothetical protein n=1 Tax=Pseudomonas sp. FP2196 TaxID=2954086 RepID=UPI0027365C0C|nr:hypothetical protein [Pseudomonas sp. FP2196]WLH37383.1 hypothetical protein PSH79_08780 [Pseudomonas sp. FP2196]
MAKPPKKIPGSTTADASTTTTRAQSDSPESPRGDIAHSLPDMTGVDPTPDSSSSTVQSERVGQRPSVIVSHMPERQQAPSAHHASMDRSADSSTLQASAVETPIDTGVHPRIYLDVEVAALLTNAQSSPEGIRYDKHKKTYVDMEAGTVMVRRNPDGSFQQTHAGETSPSGDLIEQIPGSRLWRRVEPTATTSKRPQPDVDSTPVETADAIPGPSKRARLESAIDVSANADKLMEALFSRQAGALDLSSGQWRNWAKATRPETGDSIEIDGAYYQIVSRERTPDTGLVYLQHPGFALAGGFDAFETMLRNNPSHQPKWALKRDGQWRVLENHLPFEMPMTQYVSTAFRHLSSHCEGVIARAVFDHSTQSAAPDNHSLSTMVLTVRHWINRVNNEAPTTPGLLDPLMLLPSLPTQPDRLYPGGILSLPSSSTAAFVRVDFDPQKFPGHWDAYSAAPTPAHLRTLFSTLLRENGYSVNPSSRALQEGALIFHREGVTAVFVLKLPRITGNRVPRPTLPGAEISSSVFQSRLTVPAQQELNIHLARNQVVYLMGGVQQTEPGKSTLFMVREG